MKILSIGNSFSQNAQRYVHKISVLNGKPIKTVNLYIGGCPLRKHYFNMLENRQSYEFQFNGTPTGLPVTIKDALMSDSWDFVTFQQASINSPNWESYEPYLSELYAYVKKYAPQAKPVIHQTWAYRDDIVQKNNLGQSNSEMLEPIKASYEKAMKAINADSLIPAGELMEALLEGGLDSPFSPDGHHASVGIGCLGLGLLWYCHFTGADPSTVILPEADAPVSEEEIEIIRKAVKSIL